MNDAQADPRISSEERAAFAAIGVRAVLAVPVITQGRFVGTLGLDRGAARSWSDGEVPLAEEAAERTWLAVELAHAEAALRESEERFQQFGNASSAGMWIRDAHTLAMEYVSPAIARIYGVAPDAFLGDVKVWASSILPEDRDVALKHIEQARGGEAVVHEFRIQRPDDATFRWIRNTDFPIFNNLGRVQRIGGLAEDVTEAKLAIEHQGVLLAELQHRVRNIMAIIRSTVARSAERADSVQHYAEVLRGRLLALSRVQALLTRAANSNVNLRTIVKDEVSANSQHRGQYELIGQEVDLSPKAAEVLTLAIHELATNALKYGALSVPHGKVTVAGKSRRSARRPGSRSTGPSKARPNRSQRRAINRADRVSAVN